jgi:hypothetical protein
LISELSGQDTRWPRRFCLSRRGLASRLRAYFDQRGEPNPALLVDSGHYFAYKPYFANLYNPNYLEAGDATDQFHGLILCYSRSRAFSREQLPWDAALNRDNWT